MVLPTNPAISTGIFTQILIHEKGILPGHMMPQVGTIDLLEGECWLTAVGLRMQVPGHQQPEYVNAAETKLQLQRPQYARPRDAITPVARWTLIYY